MKATLLGIGIALVVSVGFLYYPSADLEVVKEEVITVEEDKYGNLDKLIREAQEASEGVINEKLDTYRTELLKEIEDTVKAEYILEIENTISTEDY